MRCDIAVLGLLHKVVRGTAHPDLLEVFPMRSRVHTHGFDTRRERRRHGKQFVEHCEGQHAGSDYFGRSIFAACRTYNFLPAYVVDAQSVSSFQTLLTRDARIGCQSGWFRWLRMYYCRG